MYGRRVRTASARRCRAPSTWWTSVAGGTERSCVSRAEEFLGPEVDRQPEPPVWSYQPVRSRQPVQSRQPVRPHQSVRPVRDGHPGSDDERFCLFRSAPGERRPSDLPSAETLGRRSERRGVRIGERRARSVSEGSSATRPPLCEWYLIGRRNGPAQACGASDPEGGSRQGLDRWSRSGRRVQRRLALPTTPNASLTPNSSRSPRGPSTVGNSPRPANSSSDLFE